MHCWFRILIVHLISIYFFVAHGIGQELPWAGPEEVGLSPVRLDRMTETIQSYIDSGKVTGAVTLIGRHDKIAHSVAQGYLDVESGKPMPHDAIFRIASMAKLVTSVAVMILYEENHFSLNDPISTYIPELKSMKVAFIPENGSQDDADLKTEPAHREITIHDLLRHTSGFVYGGGSPPLSTLYEKTDLTIYDKPLSEFVKNLSQLPLAFQPGTQWAYGYSTDILAYFIEVISGQRLDTFFEKAIFLPLGMEDTGYFVPESKLNRLTILYEYTSSGAKAIDIPATSQLRIPPIGCAGGANMLSTAYDYARLLQMLMNDGELNGRRILSRKSVELMLMNHLSDIPRDKWYKPGIGFGLGLAIIEDVGTYGESATKGQAFWKGYYNTYFFIDPKEDMFGIFMMPMLPYKHLDLYERFRRFCMQAIVD